MPRVLAISPGRTLQQEIARIAASPSVQQAVAWLQSHERELRDWQLELVRIPAPAFAESQRADWLRTRFVQLGLGNVRLDAAGNVLGMRGGADLPGRRRRPEKAPTVAVTAHLDTVFPAGTPIHPRREGSKLLAPGISDNASGVVALLALAAALRAAALQTAGDILFIGTVGEEGEGDLRGMRRIFSDPRLKELISYTLVIDGAGHEHIVTQALGSRRFQITLRGPGGHSWNDFGLPNPIVALARALARLSQVMVPSEPRSAFNVGTIEGGTSVNSIPQSASARVDIRSVAPAEIDRLEKLLREVVADQVRQESGSSLSAGMEDRRPARLSFEIKSIGSRPAAELPPAARIVAVLRAVDAQLGIASRIRLASTDANLPISLGREAVSLGAGGSGGGAHTLDEWFDTAGRELGLQRILLSLLTLAGVQE